MIQRIRFRIEKYISYHEFRGDTKMKPFFKVSVSGKNSKQCKTLKEAREVKEQILNGKNFKERLKFSTKYNDIIKTCLKLKVNEFFTIKDLMINQQTVKQAFKKRNKSFTKFRMLKGSYKELYILKVK